MSDTTRAARIARLGTVLAGAALTAGLGLATTGTAEAAPKTHPFVCMENLHGTTTISDHGKTSNAPLRFSPGDTVCLTGTEASEGRNLGGAVMTDPLNPAITDVSVADIKLTSRDDATGKVNVTLADEIHSGPGDGIRTTVRNPVSLRLGPGNNYVMRNVTRDAAGRTADTTITFNLRSPLV